MHSRRSSPVPNAAPTTPAFARRGLRAPGRRHADMHEMMSMSLLGQAAVFLLTAVIVVPLFRRLQLGAVLGYLAAGALIGPWGLGVVPEAEATLHFAELGVVLLLFLVGLELEPSRLWALRQRVFVLGGAQVV